MIKKLLYPFISVVIASVFIFIVIHNIQSRQTLATYQSFKKENDCLALNYHRIREKTLYNQLMKNVSNSNELSKYSIFKEDFKRQLLWMNEHGAQFLNQQQFLQAYQKKEFPKGCVWISFDDADITTYSNALPVLKEFDIPATVFVIAGHVGDRNFNNLRLADWNQLNEMKESGMIDFGSHTYDMHEVVNDQPVFNKVPKQQFIKDLKKSRSVIQKRLGIKVNTFAYPYGATNDRIANSVKEAGFQYAYILAPAPVNHNVSDYYINRIMVDDHVFEHYIKKWPGFNK